MPEQQAIKEIESLYKEIEKLKSSYIKGSIANLKEISEIRIDMDAMKSEHFYLKDKYIAKTALLDELKSRWSIENITMDIAKGCVLHSISLTDEQKLTLARYIANIRR